MSEVEESAGADYAAAFAMTEEAVEAILGRAMDGALTDDDRTALGAAVEDLNELLPEILAVMDNMLVPFFAWFSADITGLFALANEWLTEQGIDARLVVKPTYRTDPRVGVELGGKPRNPEADVIDEIDRLVDWQMGQGEL